MAAIHLNQVRTLRVKQLRSASVLDMIFAVASGRLDGENRDRLMCTRILNDVRTQRVKQLKNAHLSDMIFAVN